MNDAWHWWERALEDKKGIGQAHLPVSVDSPEQGFYKMRWNKQKPWLPVAIWQDDDGRWVALRSGHKVDAFEAWNYCCRHPISSEAYERALAGEGWADDDPTVASMIGHNVQDNDIDALRDQIESAKVGADAYLDIQTDEEAAKAQSLRARMNELAGVADKTREALKRPHLEAGKEVDSLWMPLVKEAKAVADGLRKHIEVFETAKLLERRRLELERQRAEAEQLISGEEVIVPPPLPPTETVVKGSYGRAATIATEMVVTAITDQDALYSSLRGHPDVGACLLKLAQAAVRAGQTLPGVTVEERAKIS